MKKTILIVSIIGIGFQATAQKILTKEEAVAVTLKNNYNIQLTNNNVSIAKNNTSIYNSGYLPTVTASGGANYSNYNTDSETHAGVNTSVKNAETQTYSASVGINYTLFDGFNRKNTYKQLQETYNLTELQARQVTENTILTLFSAYYEVARLTENETTQKQTLAISKQRLLRANYSFDYGQNTKLDVLNAEVDVNNDSISYLNVQQQLTNAKRDLNVVLGRNVNTAVKVDTTVTYLLAMNLEDLLEQAKKNNVSLLQTQKNKELSKYDIEISKSNWFPKVSLTGSYAWNKNNYDTTNSLNLYTQKGLNGGVSLSWNIFDGGRSKTLVQNAKIALNNQEIQEKQQLQLLEQNINNAWTTYQNALFTVKVQEQNVVTTQRNFERSNERYKLGQITSIDFRQAQINYINAKLNLSNAKYNAKNAELQLLQLAGKLLE